MTDSQTPPQTTGQHPTADHIVALQSRLSDVESEAQESRDHRTRATTIASIAVLLLGGVITHAVSTRDLATIATAAVL